MDLLASAAMTSFDQLPLSLPPREPGDGRPSLPILALTADWRMQSRSWPQALHPMCTYLGSLPASLAHDLIARWSRPGDVVLDPFCGRGTVPLQAGLERRIGVGIDRSPLAHLLTSAVLDPPPRREALARLAVLQITWTETREQWRGMALTMAEGGGAATFFHPETLAQLLMARDQLDRRRSVDAFLLATMAGILHGRRASALTDAMPNTFSMAPGYAARWLAAHDLERSTGRPQRDLFRNVERRVTWLLREGRPVTRGIAINGDARDAGRLAAQALRERGLPERIRLVVTSPPYLGLVRYGQANWLRLWLLGEDPTAVDAALDAPRSVTASNELLRSVLDDLRPVLVDDAIVVVILGNVEAHRGRRLREPIDLALEAWSSAVEPAGYRLAGVNDDVVDPGRKLTRLWGTRAGGATRTERIIDPGTHGVRSAAGTVGRESPGRRRPNPRGHVGHGPPERSDFEGGSHGRPAPPASDPLSSGPMQQMYHPDDLASMDPLVLMKNLDHARMTSRRLSYILQQQVHLYLPEANELRIEIDRYVEAERQIETELARRSIRA